MGMSASQARLLTITARLTSNEYESQQITNAKMRLATRSQEASEAYISALNSSQYNFVTYNSSGESNNTPLTAAVLYEYGDNKNQYIITNSAGKALVSNADYQNYINSADLNTFLSKYGIESEFKTDTLKDNYDKCHSEEAKKAKKDWEDAIETQRSSYSQEDWSKEKLQQQQNYMNALNIYTTAVNQKNNGKDISNLDIAKYLSDMDEEKKKFTKLVSYESALESKAEDAEPAKAKDYQEKYKNYEVAYTDELDKLGLPSTEAYQYKDKTKAQWYTNLWYKMNGSSTTNTGKTNCAVLNPAAATVDSSADSQLSAVRNLASMESTSWISDALAKGYINLEMASATNATTLQDNSDPFQFNLKGISWDSKIYSSCSDIVSTDNDKATAQAEAQYEKETAEINAKDEKYQRKLSLLDSEHNAIQQEYESVKGAMDKNIERSFKAFQG